MDIIPVIDLMNGLVVHAREGRRDAYRPIQSPLCRGAEPEAVVEGLLRLWPFRTLYMADLNALMGRDGHARELARLRRVFPALTFWVDGGWPDADETGDDALVTVIGSESLDDARLPLLARREKPFVLSLDCRDGQPLGPAALETRPELWPETVILMSLSHVGSTAGPDFERIERFVRRHPERRWVAAGGVRDEADLARLDALGVAGVLLASALHGGALGPAALARYASA